jgi:hypothetical protein
MPGVGFEPTIPLFARAKMVHTLDRAATVIGTGLTAKGNKSDYKVANRQERRKFPVSQLQETFSEHSR